MTKNKTDIEFTIEQLELVSAAVNDAYDNLSKIDGFGFADKHEDRDEKSRALSDLNCVSRSISTAVTNLTTNL
jgi:hypothetical protein